MTKVYRRLFPSLKTTGMIAVAGILFLSTALCLAAEPLRVGSSGDYAPFSFRDAAGNLTGFDVDVANRLAADLGRPTVFESFKWPELVARLRQGDFEIAMSGVTQRADRLLNLTFTRPYAVTGAVALIRKSDRQRLPRLAALDRPTVKIAVNAGGHLEQVARRQFPQAQIVTANDNRALPVLLSKGSVDAVVSEEIEARSWGGKNFELLGPFTRDRKAYALARESEETRRQVDDWLADREADGWLDALRRKWLGKSESMKPAQACFEALVAAMDLRLQLMPKVAAVKRRDGLPIRDPKQEEAVLEKVKVSATTAGLDAAAVVELFRVQIEAAVAVEHAAQETAAAELNLADLRASIAGLSQQEIAELGRCSKFWKTANGRKQLRTSLEQGVNASGVSRELVARMAKAVQEVH
ncbi:MAG: transporter substrate-binding domain-containing protein [Deltaproteobacteria bacterium]|nr:transporter substrate-binding domain-containing protein [Deltaproteobacteria bacterium]